jgi:sugar (pentulose or hexulose) kinase
VTKTKNLVLGIDVGPSSIKGLVCNAAGRIVAQALPDTGLADKPLTIKGEIDEHDIASG